MNEDYKSLKKVQEKILEIMVFIDKICRDNGIKYFIMGGTALGAVRHQGFIPWDDDLDIFMTPSEYGKFKLAMKNLNGDTFVLQEWSTTEKYLEYAKVRMNGTTLIEENFKNRKDIHQGIFVDIMMLHKVPENRMIQWIIYLESKFVTLYGLSQRNWKPKTKTQLFILKLLKLLPCKLLTNIFYKNIYSYDNLKRKFNYCYWITPARFKQGLFPAGYFNETSNITFENHLLLCSKFIKEYLSLRYGDYMKLPSIEQRRAAVHAYIFDTERDYREFIEN